MPFRRRFKRGSFSKRRFGRRSTMRRRFTRKRGIPRYSKKITKMTIRPALISDKAFMKLVKSAPFQLILASPATITSTIVVGNGFLNVGPANPVTDSGLLDLDAPAGLHVWSQFYESYRIMGSKLDVQFNGSTALQSPQVPVVGIYPSRPASGPTALTSSDVLDQPYCKWQLLRTGNTIPNRIVTMMNSKKMFGQKVTSEDDYQGSISYDDATNAFAVSNPDTIFNWNIFMTVNDNTDPITINGILTITYYVLLEDRIPQNSRVPETEP